MDIIPSCLGITIFFLSLVGYLQFLPGCLMMFLILETESEYDSQWVVPDQDFLEHGMFFQGYTFNSFHIFGNFLDYILILTLSVPYF